jgi:hypothetical protein
VSTSNVHASVCVCVRGVSVEQEHVGSAGGGKYEGPADDADGQIEGGLCVRVHQKCMLSHRLGVCSLHIGFNLARLGAFAGPADCPEGH